jgi:alginate O-acetyltransferase complex protein AlgI
VESTRGPGNASVLFNSIQFALFLLAVLGVYRLLERRLRAQNALLLVASYVFYGYWDVRFLHLVVLSTVVDYYCALMIGTGRVPAREGARAAALMLGSAVATLLVRWEGLLPLLRGLGTGAGAESAASLALAPAPVEIAAALATCALCAIGAGSYRWLTRQSAERRRRVLIWASMSFNLGLLGFFKYFNFFAESFAAVCTDLLGFTPDLVTLNVILPVGISFYTFQTMSYTIDVYRGALEPCEDFLTFATFLAFFPQLVAGPIERGAQMLPQFQSARPRPSGAGVREGLWLIAWGLYKKMVVADNVAPLVNASFAGASAGVPQDGLGALIGIYAFALQIYGDFSGYSDIARGTAQLLGFRLMRNFDLPYFATTPQGFWRRWHISLSTWLRDYLYVSLGGNRGGTLLTCRNLFLTMLLGGLWHGASWTFVIWGGYHGLLLIAYRLLGLEGRPPGNLATRVLQGLLLFHLVCLGWLFFRAPDLPTASHLIGAVVWRSTGSSAAFQGLLALCFYGWFLVLFEAVQARMGAAHPLERFPAFVRLNVWIFVVMSLLALRATQSGEFIYFDF